MTDQAIAEGIKQAMQKGQSLKQAMESFYYAGYPKEEIEVAAREVQRMNAQQTTPKQSIQPKKKFTKKLLKPKTTTQVQKVSSYPSTKLNEPHKKELSKPAQKILKLKAETTQPTSNYQRQDTRPGVDWILAIMLIALLGLIGVLLFIIFKTEILNFFSS